MRIGGEEHILEAGDAIYFDASMPQSYQRASPTACAGIVVTVP
jgi:hypothetical protein